MKRALLIGCNYTSIPNVRLNGCINDIINVRNMLIDAYGYTSSNITILRDDTKNSAILPTAKNIMDNLSDVIANSGKYEELWIHYSGHGSNIRDRNKDEADGYDEVIVPLDFRQVGVITDDLIFEILKNAKCKTILFFDSCNSGSVCDLQWSFETKNGLFIKTMNPNHVIPNPNIFMISGCRDTQSSYDIYSNDNAEACGAFTNALLTCLRNTDHNIGLVNLYERICNTLKSQGFANQSPVLSSSAESPTYTFQRKVVIQQVPVPTPTPTPIKPSTSSAQKPVTAPISVKQVHNILDFNMKHIMINKAHRDPNKYIPKKLL